MALSRETQSRLYNWKFGQAVVYLDRDQGLATEDEDTVIRALARVFGNIGGFEGDLADIIYAAVAPMLTFDEFRAPPATGQVPPVTGAHP